MQYLVVNEKYQDYFFPYVQSDSIDWTSSYILHTKWDYYVMRLKRKVGLDFTRYLTTQNLKKRYDCIVVFDCSCDYQNLKYMKGKSEDVRLFIWNRVEDFLNRLRKVNKKVTMEYVKECFDVVYSFDRNDCIKYNLKYYPTLYTNQIDVNSSKTVDDIVFLGDEKGRGYILKDIYNRIEKYGYKQKFHVFDRNASCIESDGFTATSKRVPYSEYIYWVSRSRAIVDVPQSGQVGFTMRVMESIFLKKKLITTCKEIVDYKLYNPHNIFVVGIDDFSDFPTFMEGEYEEVPQEVLDYYNILTWLRNMKTDITIEEGI